MKSTGMIRRMDDLGRIVVPRCVREELYNSADCFTRPFEVFTDGDAVIFKPYHGEPDDWTKKGEE